MRPIAVYLLFLLFTTLPAKAAEPSTRTDPPPDRSLTVKEYVDRGIPSVDKPWTADDQKKAVLVLLTMSVKESDKLPRFESARSGAVFSRLVDTGVRERFLDRKIATEKRFNEAGNEFETRYIILQAYLAAFVKNGVGNAEMVEISASTLRIAGTFLVVLDEYFATIPEDDPRYARKAKSRQKIESGVRDMVMGAVLNVVVKEEPYDMKARKRMIVHLKVDVPAFFYRVRLRERARILSKLQSGIGEPHLKECQAELKELIHALQNAPLN